MPYRLFADSIGNQWQVWDILPLASERRSGENTERRVETVVIPFPDRRREARRMMASRRAILRGTYGQGWLCFESHQEKRRLSPIPDDWTTCDDGKLEAYARRGERVSGAFRMIADFDSEEPLAETG